MLETSINCDEPHSLDAEEVETIDVARVSGQLLQLFESLQDPEFSANSLDELPYDALGAGALHFLKKSAAWKKACDGGEPAVQQFAEQLLPELLARLPQPSENELKFQVNLENTRITEQAIFQMLQDIKDVRAATDTAAWRAFATQFLAYGSATLAAETQNATNTLQGLAAEAPTNWLKNMQKAGWEMLAQAFELQPQSLDIETSAVHYFVQNEAPSALREPLLNLLKLSAPRFQDDTLAFELKIPARAATAWDETALKNALQTLLPAAREQLLNEIWTAIVGGATSLQITNSDLTSEHPKQATKQAYIA